MTTPEEWNEREQAIEHYIQWINQNEAKAEKTETNRFQINQYDEIGQARKTRHFMP